MSIQTTPQTIQLKCKGLHGNYEERECSESVKPGHFLIPDTSNAGEVKKNNLTTGADTKLLIALENSLAGGVVTDAWTSGDRVNCYQPIPGDTLYVRVPASASAIVEGDRLQLDATGCMIKLASGVEKARAEEDLDNSGGGSEAFLKVTIS